MIAIGWSNVLDRRFPDPDDAMRLLQVRDWLAGQSWFDVTQYRLNLPFGAPMHWSRLVDLPIAAVILLFRPIFGADGGETAALIIVPLLTLGAAMLLPNHPLLLGCCWTALPNWRCLIRMLTQNPVATFW